MILDVCQPTEIALKSLFLGPQSENAEWLQEQFLAILRDWFGWRRSFSVADGRAISDSDQASAEFQARRGRVAEQLGELARRFAGELPKYSPRYVGHMFSELSIPALLGHFLTMLHNPNIISRESGPVAAELEAEAIGELAAMVGWRGRSWGHFTSGGTMANFEAVVRAQERLQSWLAVGACHGLPWRDAAVLGWERYRSLREQTSAEALRPFLREHDAYASWRALERCYGSELPRPKLLLPAGAHYSWDKAARFLGMGRDQIRVYASPSEIPGILREAPVAMVVSVAGTTETGAIQAVDEVAEALADVPVWHHVDAAYGGFFCCLLEMPDNGLGERACRALRAMAQATSVTLDPHKLGYVPYSSGAFLAREVADYTCVSTSAPYIDYHLEAGDRGPFTLEGSRSAAGAVATWLTARTVGLNGQGYGLLLARTLRQKQALERCLLRRWATARVVPGCDTNLLCFTLAEENEPVSRSNARCLEILHRLGEQRRYFLSKTEFARAQAEPFVAGWKGVWDAPGVTVLRLCLMNPFFDSHELEVRHVEDLVECLAVWQ